MFTAYKTINRTSKNQQKLVKYATFTMHVDSWSRAAFSFSFYSWRSTFYPAEASAVLMILYSKENDLYRIDLGDRRLLVHETDRHLAFMQILKETLLTNQRALLRTHPAAATGLKFHIPRFVPIIFRGHLWKLPRSSETNMGPPTFCNGKSLKIDQGFPNNQLGKN